MSSPYRSNRNVVFSCKYHVVWCPKYRRSVLVDGADEALKGIVARVCQAREAEMIELEVMPDHVHLLVDIDPQYGIHRLIKDDQGYKLSRAAPELPLFEATTSDAVDQQLFRVHGRRCAFGRR